MSTPAPGTSKSRYSEAASDASSFQENNDESTRLNRGIPVAFQTPTTAAIFRSNTIAPSPPPTNEKPDISLDTSHRLGAADPTDGHSSPHSTGLRIQTDIRTPKYSDTPSKNKNVGRSSTELTRIPSVSRTPSIPITPLVRTPSIKNVFASSVGSSSAGSRPGSAISSPMLNALSDLTPLPSPLMPNDSPGPWKQLANRAQFREKMLPVAADSALVTANGESISSAIANQFKRKAYQGLASNQNESGLQHVQANKEKGEGHQRERSISEYQSNALKIPKPRHITVSGSHASMNTTPDASPFGHGLSRRGPHLAAQRGLPVQRGSGPTEGPPTPPSSRTGCEGSDSDSSIFHETLSKPGSKMQYFDAKTRDGQQKTWRGLRSLANGAFGQVILATSELELEEWEKAGVEAVAGHPMDGVMTSGAEIATEERRKKLVAIKVCESGPKGGVDEARLEMLLKRELENLTTLHHPSIVHLQAWSVEETRALLVLDYYPGGDLFTLAAENSTLLVPSLVRRIFAELVGAVLYLHDRHIVHRDIKLDNILLNLTKEELASPIDWQAYRHPIVALGDFGFSRRVADDEKLSTPLGSDEYVTPEVILHYEYDGHDSDTWALAVCLFALLEDRFPFEAIRTAPKYAELQLKWKHRTAMAKWVWLKYGGDEGDHDSDPAKFEKEGLLGAMRITEGILRKRNRWTMKQVAEEEWVFKGIQVEGGLKCRHGGEDKAGDIDASPV